MFRSAVDSKVTEECLNILLSHVFRMLCVVKADIFQYPADIGFLGIVGVVMEPKDFTHLIHEAGRFRHEFPCCFIHIRNPLSTASFACYFYIIGANVEIYCKKYEDVHDLITTSYNATYD